MVFDGKYRGHERMIRKGDLKQLTKRNLLLNLEISLILVLEMGFYQSKRIFFIHKKNRGYRR